MHKGLNINQFLFKPKYVICLIVFILSKENSCMAKDKMIIVLIICCRTCIYIGMS